MGARANVLVGVASISIQGMTAGKRGGLGAGAVTGFYTTDGVTLSVRSDFADIKVEENIGTIIRKLIDQEVSCTMNIAEGALNNMITAIPGSYISGSVITLGGGDPAGSVLQEFKLTLVGKTPTGTNRTIVLNEVNPTGEVGMPYKKGETTVFPVTFAALVADNGQFGTITDS